MTIGERIKNRREEFHLSQTALAERVGITKQSLYKYEKGIITNIPSDVIERLASFLYCSPAYLMGWENKPERVQKIASRLSNLNDKQLDDVEKYLDFIEMRGE